MEQATQTDVTVHVTDSSVQTDGSLEVKEQGNLPSGVFGITMIQGSDNKFYTGLPTWSMFLHVFMFLSPFISPSWCVAFDDEFFLTLVKLRLNLFALHLSSRFDISVGSVNHIFQKWLDVMFIRLQFLITWPSREVLQQNMPLVFQQLYPNCRVIIDCSEIFIETPTTFDARAKTYSNYKKHNTVKFFNRYHTMWYNFVFIIVGVDGSLTKTLHKRAISSASLNQVLADRWFALAEDLAIHGARLEIPSFTRGKKQLSQEDVEKSKRLSKVQIHVERVIGLLKNRYTILKGQYQLV